MSKKIIVRFLSCLTPFLGMSAHGQHSMPPRPPGQQMVTTSNYPENPESRAHIQAAMRLAGREPVLMKAWTFFCTAAPFNEPGAELKPVKVFDNLYAIPSSPIQQTTVWAITTSDGIILIDSGYEDTTAALLQEAGLNPADVKYILLGHGHGDHYAGAAGFQERYGTRVGTSAGDWDVIHPPGGLGTTSNQDKDKRVRPKRDLVLKEGTPIKLGEQTVHVVEIPGHTPGSLAFIFNVREGGETHTAGLFGGTILGQWGITTDGLNQYIGSIDHYLEIAKKMNVDVEIQNHGLFDDMPGRLAKLKTRKPGEPNPFIMTTDKYVDMWHLVSECIRAEIARRPPDSK